MVQCQYITRKFFLLLDLEIKDQMLQTNAYLISLNAASSVSSGSRVTHMW